MLVKEIMSAKVEWVSPDAPIQEAARKMRDRDIGSLPVRERDDGKLVGIVTDRDIACRAVAEGRDPATTTVGEVMSAGATCCFDDQDVGEAAHLMEEKQLHRLPVFDHENHLVGMLAIGDLALRAPHELSGEVLEAVSRHTH